LPQLKFIVKALAFFALFSPSSSSPSSAKERSSRILMVTVEVHHDSRRRNKRVITFSLRLFTIAKDAKITFQKTRVEKTKLTQFQNAFLIWKNQQSRFNCELENKQANGRETKYFNNKENNF